MVVIDIMDKIAQERDNRIAELREKGYSQREIGEKVGLSRRRVREIIERDRPDLVGHNDFTLTEREKDFVIMMRLKNYPFKEIEQLSGIPTWKAKRMIKEEVPGLSEGGAFYDFYDRMDN